MIDSKGGGKSCAIDNNGGRIGLLICPEIHTSILVFILMEFFSHFLFRYNIIAPPKFLKVIILFNFTQNITITQELFIKKLNYFAKLFNSISLIFRMFVLFFRESSIISRTPICSSIILSIYFPSFIFFFISTFLFYKSYKHSFFRIESLYFSSCKVDYATSFLVRLCSKSVLSFIRLIAGILSPSENEIERIRKFVNSDS